MLNKLKRALTSSRLEVTPMGNDKLLVEVKGDIIGPYTLEINEDNSIRLTYFWFGKKENTFATIAEVKKFL